MRKYLAVRNWERWQSYRADRGTPPWIKIHRRLMSSATWADLKDCDKGHLVSIWLIAADRDGIVPADPDLLRKICMLDNVPDVEKLIKLGYLEPAEIPDGVKLTSTWRQGDSPETETETETETEEIYALTNNDKPTKKTEKKVTKKKAVRRKTSLKANLKLAEDWKEYCVTKRPDLKPDDVFEDFKEFYISHGRTMANWKMTWQRWVRNERRGKNGNNNQPETPLDRADRIIRDKGVVS